MGSRKTGLSPPLIFTDRSKAVLLLWFLSVTCSCCPYLYFGSAIMLVTYFVNFRFSASAFFKLPSIYVFSYFPFGFEGRLWDLIVSVPDHCLSFYFKDLPVLLLWFIFICYHNMYNVCLLHDFAATLRLSALPSALYFVLSKLAL